MQKRVKMNALDSVLEPLREFSKDSIQFVKRCHKPDRKEFTKVAKRIAIGIVVLGLPGYLIKFVSIPVNYYIFGS